MPGTEPASGDAGLRRGTAAPKVLYAVDATAGPGSPVHDARALAAAAAAAVRAGNGHVLDTALTVFPNGAITLVLILAESHLSIHTWPEDDLVAIDLFSCGAIDGARVIGTLAAALGLTDVRITELRRG